MAGESQLTFDDVLDTEVPERVYSSVSDIADAITEANRERSGDNCATVSRRMTDDGGSYTFCIQLPPRTGEVSYDVIESSEVETVSFTRSEVVMDNPPYIIWEFTIELEVGETLVDLIIVKPVEEPDEDENEEDESFIDSYDQFDFTQFVRES